MDEEANKQTTPEKPQMVQMVLANGQVITALPLLLRDNDGLYVQVTFTFKRKNGKVKEVPMARMIPYSSILWWDILPELEEEGNDGGTES